MRMNDVNDFEMPEQPESSDVKQHRTLWLSDIHLGTKDCQAHALLDFLAHNDAECIYLVGDIIDGWQLKKRWYWPQAHNDVIQKLLRKARKGTRIVFIPVITICSCATFSSTHRIWPWAALR